MKPPSPEQWRPIKSEVTKNTLFINAHPDDESMAHGGAISALTDQDPKSVFVLTASLGEASTKGDNSGRKEEAEAAYDTLGVEKDHRFYHDLPDTELNKPANILALVGVIVEYIEEHDINTLVTPGWDGFDDHSDHKAVHIAAILAAQQVKEEKGREVNVLGLNARGEGEIYARVDYDKKYQALSHHHSQFMDDLDNIIDEHEVYNRLMKEETFNRNNTPEDLARAQQALERPIPQFIPE